jgi:glutaredoxin 3
MVRVRVYSIPECPYCTELKEILQNEGIEFIDVNVNLDENQEEYDKVYEITKSDEVPIVLVNKQFLIPNTSFKTIKEAANLTKKFLT